MKLASVLLLLFAIHKASASIGPERPQVGIVRNSIMDLVPLNETDKDKVTLSPPNELAEEPLIIYDCVLTLNSKEFALPKVFPTFPVWSKGSSIIKDQNLLMHGGAPVTESYNHHFITMIANGRWLGITWTHSGILVASAETVRADTNQTSQILIARNPQDPEEYVAISCQARDSADMPAPTDPKSK